MITYIKQRNIIFLMSSKLVKIYLNGQQITAKKLCLSDTLKNTREKLSDKINDSYLYTLKNGDKIGISEESEITLEDILIDNKKIYMTINEDTSKSIPKKNTPIEGSKLIGNIGNLKLYQYPDIKLTDFEESSSISLLVVGQTGSGKTTLLNAFINALMDIE